MFVPSWPPRDADHLLVSGAQMAQLEQTLFDSGMPVEALMEKAALAISRRLMHPDWWPRLQERGALVLVGPGHNGGDGLVVARELHLAGIAVRIWSPFEQHKPLTAAHRSHARWLGIPQLNRSPDPGDPALWIDALFGIGQRRPPGDALETLLEQRQQLCPGQLIAIDGPSGLCSDEGVLLGRVAACACLTLSLGLLKQGFLQDTALAWVGELERIDLALAPALLQALPPQQPLALDAGDLENAPWPVPPAAASKYERGRLLVVAGSEAYRGAALLCLAGASATGIGSLRAALPEAVADGLWSVQPHTVIASRLGSRSDGSLNLAELQAETLERLDALVLGPGIGSALDPSEDQIWARLQAFSGLLLLDADGLNRLALRGALPWLQGRQGPTWLTPHPGEFARLFPELSDLPPIRATIAAAQQSRCCVLRKGARSVVSDPSGQSWQLRSASSSAARAGLGDVLSGYASGIGAQARAIGAETGGALLAAAALAHAQAGLKAGGATPSKIAEILESRATESVH
ncbi:MAG: NAD(P)H-hydrate dehydratase [Cyanobacteria bacterium M_surface_10_m1_298]|nr:NAD(P)H-hydrate dehydratase [Cyanobacteria bacterium M_surface_10_m1_298]